MSKCKCPKLDCWDEVKQLARHVAKLARRVKELEKAVDGKTKK